MLVLFLEIHEDRLARLATLPLDKTKARRSQEDSTHMNKVIVVTHHGPCFVPRKVFREIADRKQSNPAWGAQILFTVELDSSTGLDISVVGGECPDVKTFADFDRDYILSDPPGRRNIIL
jgi:hypothetical protein